MREQAGPAPEIHERAARLEDAQDLRPGRASKPQGEVRALGQRERGRGFPESRRFAASEREETLRRRLDVPLHLRP